MYDPEPGIRVYEAHGDLLFSGAEQVIRVADRERDAFQVAILDVSRIDDIDDAARALLSGMAEELRSDGKSGFVVDPDRSVIRADSDLDASRFASVADAVDAARLWLDAARRGR